MPFKPAAVPFKPAAVPLEPAAALAATEKSPHCPAASLPFGPAEVPFETAGLPSVASELPLMALGNGQAAAGLKAASPLVTRPTEPAATQPARSGQSMMPATSKAGLPITSPPAKAGLPITSPATVTQPAPKAAEAARLPVTPPSSGPTGMFGTPPPLSPPSTQSTLLPNQPTPGHTSTSNAVAAATTATALNHCADQQGISRPAALTQAPSEAICDGAAVPDISLESKVLIQATSGRRCPRARNQIVHAVMAHAEAVSEPVRDGSAVLGQSREQASAAAASKRFPRARNPIVHAVGARDGMLLFVGGKKVVMEQAAAEEEDADASKPAAAAIPRLNLTGVCHHHNSSV